VPAVSNSSPFILFAAIDRFELLHDLYGEIIAPEAVWRGITVSGEGLPGAAEASSASRVRRVSVTDAAIASLSLARLHRGETEAIAMAVLPSPPVPILLDDRRARRVARTDGLKVTGAAGVVVEAKLQGLVPSVRPMFAAPRTADLYLPEAALGSFVQLAGER
jgi:predicted nucleic acid-binding protein